MRLCECLNNTTKLQKASKYIACCFLYNDNSESTNLIRLNYKRGDSEREVNDHRLSELTCREMSVRVRVSAFTRSALFHTIFSWYLFFLSSLSISFKRVNRIFISNTDDTNMMVQITTMMMKTR